MFLKQNAATFSSKTVMQSSFFFVVEFNVLELRTKSFGTSIENASKTTKLSNFLTVHGQLEAISLYQLNLSRDESPYVRRSNILVHEIYRRFDKY